MAKPLLVVAALIALLSCTQSVYAQSGGFVQLTASPALPQVGDAYTVSLYTNNLQSPREAITWFVNGIEYTESKNQTSLTLQADSDTTRITARVHLLNGSVLEDTFIVDPYRIDLIIHSDTAVPAFYNGRSLPVSGSMIRATALLFDDGVAQNSGYSYLWKLDGKTKNSGSLYGQNTFTFTTGFEHNALLSVDVFDSSNTRIAHEVREIALVDPELHFYEKNPLYGLLPTALHDPHIFIGEELKIRAEGYFMDTELQSADTHRQWQIDNRDVTNGGGDPQEIVLRKEGAQGSSFVSFHIRNLSQLLQGVERGITIQF